ncbi:tripartite tricarboxylate transporter substrate binding protein [Xenophilus arseniciresistens]|uniref:Tripartite tricarboxylate transporter substrate binding protein n=1 Tax=Xenophilus arseniciresistens TaxID=1283306 RepID=A0AAE3N5J8_9BURK|nr:tripartite tricarboxylate transporter substrate binding protein [Xenophilus arseniciresistens]MDA7415651.1 tripartite tricarboxylate transporter substrate binding protein [Xenophilus arseniciresistens]
MPPRRRLLRLAASVATAASLLPLAAQAQAFPDKTVTLVVPFPAGAGPDAVARLLAQKLSASLGQSVVVDNRAGASGTLGATFVARAPADGYTLLLTPNTFAIAPHLIARGAAPTDVVRDFTPIVQVASTPLVLVARPDLGVRDARALAELARKSKDITYGSSGSGSPMHIGGELFNRAAGVQTLHVPYKGVAPAITDLLGGHLKLNYTSLASVMPHLQSGKLLALGTLERERTPLLPALPTLVEQGFKDVAVQAWYGLLGPRGLPAPVVQTLNQHVNAALAQPDVVEQLKALGATPVGGTPEKLGQLVQADFTRYGRVIQEFGIRAD